MNTNLKKLIDDAGIHKDVCRTCPILNVDKLAKLIIEDCARIANEKEENFPQYNKDISVSWYIKKHFGLD